MANHETVIEAQGLTKRFGGKTVVDGVDLEVKKGQIHGFLGPNGSGKTTFIRMLCGLLKPDAGRGTCLGFDIVKEAHKIKPNVGYMVQRFSLYEDLTVRENLTFIARLYRMKNTGPAVDSVIERMGLGRFVNHLAGALSGGWKQRLALAACILPQPKLLLLDEPTAGVDPAARRDFWQRVHELSAEGITSLISTHYMDEAERCHRLAYIAYGHLLAVGSVEELIRNSGLTTFTITGPNAFELTARLREKRCIRQVVPFGNTLHVSGTDPKELAECLEEYKSIGYEIRRAATGLEEIFIDLMRDREAA